MEQFLLDNAARHQLLVSRFKPPRTTPDIQENPNITVATRIRPLLEHESSTGQVVAVYPRVNESGVVDLHDLRRVVRGFPPLNVTHPHPI